jgi:hypothetical protein
MAVVFVGVLIVGAARLLGAFAKARTVQIEQAKTRAAAELLLSEILRARYAEPGSTSGWGPESGEVNGTSRVAFDDLDDYDGLTCTPCRDRDGTPIPGYEG